MSVSITSQQLSALNSNRWSFTLWESPAPEICSVVDCLKLNLPHIDQDSWQSRINFGGVYFNGRRILADRPLEFPAKIEYYEPKFKIEEAENFFPQICENDLVYRKDGIIAFNKPSGLPSMASKDNLNHNLRSQVTNMLGSACSIHMPSRLDSSVSGLIVMSEDPNLHGALQRLFEKKLIIKRYLALASGNPPWFKTVIDLPIARDPRWGVLRTIDQINGKVSQTKVCKILSFKDNPSKALLAVYPLTGRTHQIRLHLSAIGFPIIGDRFYGGFSNEHLHLVSCSLKFMHPRTGEHIKIRLPQKAMPSWYQNIFA